LKIAVCAKQIPDPATPYQLDPDTHFVIRPEDQILDDTDRYGVELGLQLAEASEGTVTIVSMGPTGSMQGIRQALAMGADRAVVVDDDALRGADALLTARVLAAAIARDEFDLVIAGTESTDGYTGIVPQQMAELLEMPALTYARRVEITDGEVKIEQQRAGGYNEVASPLPALVTVTAGVVEPRYPTFKGIMAAKSKPVDVMSAADLGIASPTVEQRITEVAAVPARQAGEMFTDEGDGHLHIVAALEEAKVI
jgi:electron transfer flavoprotein beta subunit